MQKKTYIFQPCTFVRHFPVLHFPVLHFQSPPSVHNTGRKYALDSPLFRYAAGPDLRGGAGGPGPRPPPTEGPPPNPSYYF